MIKEEKIQLRALIKKSDNQFDFIVRALVLQQSGKLKLKTRGVANFRELVALYFKVKEKSMSESITIPVALKDVISTFSTMDDKRLKKLWHRATKENLFGNVFDKKQMKQVMGVLRGELQKRNIKV